MVVFSETRLGSMIRRMKISGQVILENVFLCVPDDCVHTPYLICGRNYFKVVVYPPVGDQTLVASLALNNAAWTPVSPVYLTL